MLKDRPSWLENAVFYQIYPQSFRDSNGDGTGDLNGIIQRLDYIQSLGVNALWLNPCFVSPFQDAGYDVADYYKVAPRYGRNADLKKLCDEAHRRHIKVCLDLVPGHTSIEHPWFKMSCRSQPNQYSDRYIWTSTVWEHSGGDLSFIKGYAERNGSYLTNFFYCQPALNYGFANPDPKYSWQQPVNAPGPLANRRELVKIMRFWLDKGADGFRVDMAGSLVKNDPGHRETIKLWREIWREIRGSNPEAALIAEWGNPAEAIQAGFDIDFMFHFGVPGYGELMLTKDCFFRRAGGRDINGFLQPYLEQVLKTKEGLISIPSANHDYQRPASDERTEKDLKVIFTMLLTWPGVPFIYYGDEIGMRYLKGLPSKEGGYERTGTRTPMQWDDGPNAGFSTAPSKKLYLLIDQRRSRPTVKAQQNDTDSLLNHVKKLIDLRKNFPALQTSGELIPVFAEKGRQQFAYIRKCLREEFLIILNPSGSPAEIRLDGIRTNNKFLKIGRGAKALPDDGGTTFKLSGVAYGVFQI